LHRILNPLAELSKEELLADVAGFCTQYGFQDKLDIFQKGALAAQYPKDFEQLEELDEGDKYHLRREITRKLHPRQKCRGCYLLYSSDKWHLPKALYFTVAICSLGSAIQYVHLPAAYMRFTC